MPRSVWVTVGGIWIRIYTQVRQSVNFCTAANQAGVYDRKIYLKPGFHVTAAEINRFGRVRDAIRWLEKRSYRQLV